MHSQILIHKSIRMPVKKQRTVNPLYNDIRYNS